MIAWRRATLANARRNFLWPTVGRAGRRSSALLAFGVTGSADRADHVRLRRLRGRASLGQELWRGVRRAARDDRGGARARARERSCGATAGATAATSSTSAWRVLFVGVAASSAFQHARDVRLTPGQTATRRRLRGHLRAPDRARGRARRRRRARSRSARDLRVRKHGERSRDLHTERGYYPSAAPFASGGLVRGLFEGEATSEVGMKAGPAARHLDRDPARPRVPQQGHRRGGRPHGRQARRPAGAARSSGLIGRLPARRRPGAVPPARLAAGGVDLDRRR